MIPTIENPGPFDALAKARPGEPFFQLLGRDHAAPGAITEWCRARLIAAASEALREAAYHTNNAIEHLDALGLDAKAINEMSGKTGFAVFTLSDALEQINMTADAITPKRAGVQQPLPMPEPIAPSFEEGQ